jgi:glycosyltransferase involved in cell wall biosynthesis
MPYMKPKLCYVLPRYETADASHFSHIHDFLREIGGIFDIYLVIEKGSKPPASLGHRKAYVLKSRFIIFRIIETKVVFLLARFSGYRDFYVHYSFLSAFFTSLITKIFGGRVFYWNCGEPWKYKRNFLREIFERLVYKMVTHLVTGAPSLADKYVEHYGIKRESILIMPNWIDLKRFKATLSKEEARSKFNIPHDAKVVLFAHHLSPRKGSRMILPVAKEVIGAHPNTIFIVAGSGPDEDFLSDEIKNNGLGKNVRLVGAVANRELPDYFIASDVFFMPSEEEGFPRVLLESMALGIPFVASDVGAVSDITPAFMRQYVVSYGNTKAFVEKIEELTSKGPTEQSTIYSGLMKEAMKYNVSVVATRFRELFF